MYMTSPLSHLRICQTIQMFLQVMKEKAERLSEVMEKFRDSDPMEEHELADADFLAAYHKGRFWRAKRVTGTPLELHTFQYGVMTASVFLIDRGEEVKVPINKIHKLSMDDLLRGPDPLCFRAHIADVIPVAEDGKWSKMATSFFEGYIWRREDLKVIQRGTFTGTSMPVELLFSESFTETPFSPARLIVTTMSRKLMREDHARAKPIENDELLEDAEDDTISQDSTLTIPERLERVKTRLSAVKLEVRQFEPIVTNWLPPLMLTISDNEAAMTKMRMTAVDGAFQLYGHQEKAKYHIKAMRAYYDALYNEDSHQDLKEEWRLGEACVAKLNGHWYRAQVIEVLDRKEVAVIHVDLGRVRKVDIEDLRIPRAFGDKVCKTNIQFSNQIESLIWSLMTSTNGASFPHF